MGAVAAARLFTGVADISEVPAAAAARPGPGGAVLSMNRFAAPLAMAEY